MMTQFVNQIEHHPESLFVQADIAARMKRNTVFSITKRFHAIRAFWRRVSVRERQSTRISTCNAEVWNEVLGDVMEPSKR